MRDQDDRDYGMFFGKFVLWFLAYFTIYANTISESPIDPNPSLLVFTVATSIFVLSTIVTINYILYRRLVLITSFGENH